MIFDRDIESEEKWFSTEMLELSFFQLNNIWFAIPCVTIFYSSFNETFNIGHVTIQLHSIYRRWRVSYYNLHDESKSHSKIMFST